MPQDVPENDKKKLGPVPTAGGVSQKGIYFTKL